MKKSLDYLFISKVRIKALKYFYFHPDIPIHLRGAVRELKEEINAVRRELNRLEEIKIVETERRGNRKYYKLNRKHPYFDDILAIIHKTFGLGGDLLRSLRKLNDVKFIVLTSSYTLGIPLEPNDIDLVIVGNVDLNFLDELVSIAEKSIGRQINYTVLTEYDFEIRKKRRDTFITQIVTGNHILVYGDKTLFVS